MKLGIQIISFLVITVFSFMTFADELIPFTPSSRARYIEAQNFLIGLGYEDYSAQARKTLDFGKNISEISKLALEKSEILYEALNKSRDLAALTYAFIYEIDKLPSPQKEDAHRLIGKMLAQQTQYFPLIGLEITGNPSYFQTRGSGAEDIRNEWLTVRANERNQIEKKNIFKLFLLLNSLTKIIDEDDVHFDYEEWLDEELSEALAESYLKRGHQQNRYFGRALVAVVVKYARETQQTDYERALKANLKTVDVDLEEIVAARYKTWTLKSGDIALEFSQGREAYFISMGVAPSREADMQIAKKYDLISSYINIPTFAFDEQYTRAVIKQKENRFLLDREEDIINTYKDPKISKGFSHSGLVEVRRDEKTQIQMSWIWDIFPHQNIGVIRLMTPTGFAFSEKNIRIGFARYNPLKVLKSFKKQIATRGYKEFVWQSRKSELGVDMDGEKLPIAEENTIYNWPSTVSKDVVLNWYNTTADENAEEWYQHKLLPNVFARIHSYLYGPQALVFAEGLTNAQNMAYCSQLIVFAFKQGGNFDIQTAPDVFRNIPKLVSMTNSGEGIAKIDIKSQVIAPAGLVWQADILDSMVQFDFSRQRFDKQMELVRPTMAEKYTNFLSREPLLKNEPSIQLKEILKHLNLNIFDDY